MLCHLVPPPPFFYFTDKEVRKMCKTSFTFLRKKKKTLEWKKNYMTVLLMFTHHS